MSGLLQKLLLKIVHPIVESKVGKYLTAKPGLLRTTVVLYVIVTAVLAFFHVAEPLSILTQVFSWLGLAAQTAGMPVDPHAVGEAFTNFLKALLVLLAVLRPIVRWVEAGFKQTQA